MGEKVIWLDIALLCCIFTRCTVFNHQIIDLLYTTLILVVPSKYIATAHARFKGRFACIFNELPVVGLFLAFDSASTRTDHFTSGKKYRRLVNNAVFIRNKSLFFVSAAATSAFQLEHTSRLLRSVCPGGYGIRTIENGKIFNSHEYLIVM